MLQKLGLALFLAGCASYQGIYLTGQAPLSHWSGMHPLASRDLGLWVDSHPDEAAWLFNWLGTHPGRANELFLWTVVNGQSIQAFNAEHHPLDGLTEYVSSHVTPLDEFLNWCRRFAPDSRALLAQSQGLSWASSHLDSTAWHLEHPGD